jgi:ribosomal protein S18 acetylase RimI-like enzyme
MIELAWFDGPRDRLMPLFELADDSPAAIASYRDAGDVLVALDGAEIVGHALLIESGPGELELKSLAVRPDPQRRGIGRRLVERSADEARTRGCTRLVLSTATADVQLLAFYQRLAFRLVRIEADVFTSEAGYPELTIDGIPLRDQVWLARAL